MKGIVLRLALALAALTVVPNALAADTDSGNFFVDAKLGKSTNRGDFTTGPKTETDSSWGADAGYLWNVDDARSLGFDVGYMHFGTIADSGDVNAITTERVSATALMVGGHFRYFFSDDRTWYLQARAGWMRAKLDSSTYFYPPNPPATIHDSWHESGVYLGIGIGRQITRSFSLGVAYTRYNTSYSYTTLGLDWIGLEAEYRF